MNAIKLWVSLLAITFSMPSLYGQYRAFKNQDGQTITAIVMKKQDGKIRLRTKDRKEYDYPIAKLSKEDQEYIAKWTPQTHYYELPETMSKRCLREGLSKRLVEAGGNQQCEEAVLKSLRWMKSTQAPDGSWGAKNKSAMTGLGLLAYLGHCETPLSEEFGESCLKAMVYLINLGIKNNGKIVENTTAKEWPYEHAIAVQALAESIVFCNQLTICVPNLEEITLKAGQFLIDHQNVNGGWAYSYQIDQTAHTDLCISGWQVHALKAMEHTDLEFKNLSTCAVNAIKFVESMQRDDGGFGYTSPHKSNLFGDSSLTGVGVSCLQLWDKGDSEPVLKGTNYIQQHSKLKWGTAECDLYSHYFQAQAMMQRGGEHWIQYNQMMRDEVLNNQLENGSWKTPEGKLRAVAPVFQTNEFYRTALCTIILEVYYRHFPTTPQ